MARYRHRRTHKSNKPTNGRNRTQIRDANAIARNIMLRGFESSRRIVHQNLQALEDFRHERQDTPTRQYTRLDGRRATVAFGPTRPLPAPGILRQPGLHIQERLQFLHPRETIVCVRRQTRRRVLFALRHIGRGQSKLPLPARWTRDSEIVCRRV